MRKAKANAKQKAKPGHEEVRTATRLASQKDRRERIAYLHISSLSLITRALGYSIEDSMEWATEKVSTWTFVDADQITTALIDKLHERKSALLSELEKIEVEKAELWANEEFPDYSAVDERFAESCSELINIDVQFRFILATWAICPICSTWFNRSGRSNKSHCSSVCTQRGRRVRDLESGQAEIINAKLREKRRVKREAKLKAEAKPET